MAGLVRALDPKSDKERVRALMAFDHVGKKTAAALVESLFGPAPA